MEKKFSIVKNYEFKKFTDIEIKSANLLGNNFDGFGDISDDEIEIERIFAKKNNFDILPIVREKRGINAQEDAEKEKIIEEEVEKRVNSIKEEAFKNGYEEGKESGKRDVYDQTRVDAGEKLERLSEIINEVLEMRTKIINGEKSQICDFINTLTKWVILRELKDDSDYTGRLLERLILEIQTKSGIVVYVDEEKFKKMPKFIKYVEEKLGSLENVRVEINKDMEGPGIIIDSENGIINGTIEEQFRSLDKIFASIGSVKREDGGEE